ncbi:MAG: pilus assembly protein, partial [Bdellovibrionales bacterium]|nr:pilus assembly protein [Bdellovibrionales bacterium]
MSKLSANRDRESGSTLVEATLSSMVFIVIVLSSVDIGRYIYYYMVLNHAAYSAMDIAIGLSRMETDGSACTGSNECENYEAQLQEVITEAQRLALIVAGTSDSNPNRPLRLV